MHAGSIPAVASNIRLFPTCPVYGLVRFSCPAGPVGRDGTISLLLLLAGLVNTRVERSNRLPGFEKAAAATEVQVGFLAEFWRFLRVRKKFWPLPILIIMAMFGGLIVVFHGSAVAPFIYTLF